MMDDTTTLPAPIDAGGHRVSRIAQLANAQKAAGQRARSTTKLYDRRDYNPEKAARFFATY